MSLLRPDQLAKGAAIPWEELVDVRATLAAYQALLKLPAFEHSVDVNVLTKIATTEALPVKEKRRAAEMLATIRLKAMDRVSEITAAREQVLKALGLDVATMKALAVTQVNNVQIDARRVNVEADRDTLRRLLADPEAADLAGALARRLDARPGHDGAAPHEGALLDPAACGPALEGGGGDGADGRAAAGADAAAPQQERDV
jgi:hypothetical protein